MRYINPAGRLSRLTFYLLARLMASAGLLRAAGPRLTCKPINHVVLAPETEFCMPFGATLRLRQHSLCLPNEGDFCLRNTAFC